jgi:LPXTG-site transpeptidase (sortase) family protein
MDNDNISNNQLPLSKQKAQPLEPNKEFSLRQPVNTSSNQTEPFQTSATGINQDTGNIPQPLAHWQQPTNTAPVSIPTFQASTLQAGGTLNQTKAEEQATPQQVQQQANSVQQPINTEALASVETAPLPPLHSVTSFSSSAAAPAHPIHVNQASLTNEQPPQDSEFSDPQAVEMIRSKIAAMQGDGIDQSQADERTPQLFERKPMAKPPTITGSIEDAEETNFINQQLEAKPLEEEPMHLGGERVIQPLHNIEEIKHDPVIDQALSSFETFQLPSSSHGSVPTTEPIIPSSNIAPPEEDLKTTTPTNLNEPIKSTFSISNLKAQASDVMGDKKALFKRIKPAIKAALIGVIIFGIFNSQALVGQIQYLTSTGAGAEIPPNAISTNEVAVPADPRIIIPKINVNVPVVYDEKSFDEARVQKALERGVVHYGTTAIPGQVGNNVIVGHSSNNWWASGKYKFAFVLLDKLETGDTFVLHYESKRYVYKVSKKVVVGPTDLSVLSQSTDVPIVTLITCTPPGTSLRRLVVVAEQISPEPTEASTGTTNPAQLDDSKLPGNPPSFFDKIRQWIGG